MMQQRKDTCVERIGANELTVGNKPHKLGRTYSQGTIHRINYPKSTRSREGSNAIVVYVITENIFENVGPSQVQFVWLFGYFFPIGGTK